MHRGMLTATPAADQADPGPTCHRLCGVVAKSTYYTGVPTAENAMGRWHRDDGCSRAALLTVRHCRAHQAVETTQTTTTT